MRILALDSSGLVASVAVVEDGAVDDQVIAEYTVNYKKTHSQTLLPMLDEIVKMTELDLHTVDAIAVAGGPGSFTGLRIGSATAKGLGLALEKPLIHIPTLEGLACNLCGIADVVCPIMDARRQQVYTGIYYFEQTHMKILKEQYGGKVPDRMEDLLRLPGVGRKTANLILGDIYGQEGYVCDTHCIRITGRLGLTDGSKDPVKVEKQLRACIPPEKSSDFCHRMVLFGRDVCTARSPKCEDCPLKADCAQGKKLK